MRITLHVYLACIIMRVEGVHTCMYVAYHNIIIIYMLPHIHDTCMHVRIDDLNIDEDDEKARSIMC